MSTYTEQEISEARRQLTVAVRQLASDTVKASGIDYRAISPEYWQGPDTWQDLQRVHGLAVEARARGEWVALPVYGGASDQTIYTSEAANHAFRYWHDMGHIQFHLSFTPSDESRLQKGYHLDDMWRVLGRPVTGDVDGTVTVDWRVDSDTVVDRAALLAFRMYYADTVGQIEYIVRNGKFPTDQLAFVLAYVTDAPTALDTDY